MKSSVIDPHPLVSWLKAAHPDVRFVGISTDQEVFLEYTSGSEALENIVATTLKTAFPEVQKTIFVVKPSLLQMEQMVQELNKLLEPPKNNLLQIG